jgi:hypothetical protein
VCGMYGVKNRKVRLTFVAASPKDFLRRATAIRIDNARGPAVDKSAKRNVRAALNDQGLVK